MRGQTLLSIASLAVVGLVACDSDAITLRRSELTAASEPVVFRVSADGRHLEGFGVRNGITPLGRVALPKGAVWSVVGAGHGLRVWVHSDERVMLVDAHAWKVLGDWARPLGGAAQPVLVQRGGGPG